jgi:cytochrome c oxidase subunit III
MLFGALFASYLMMRVGAADWPRGDTILNVPLATLNTVVFISSSVTMVMAWASLKRKDFAKYRLFMGGTVLLGFGFFDHQVLRVLGEVPPRSLSRRPAPSWRSTSR